MKINELRTYLERLKGKQEQLIEEIQDKKRTVKRKTLLLEKHEKAKEIIREVGLETQKQLQFHISDITSIALESVFPNPYELEIEFIQRRNKTECDIYFTRDGNRINPLMASGCGAVDVACFALRIASWSLEHPHTRNIIIMDEPMRFVSAEYRINVSQMIKEVGKKLGLQLIIITHDSLLTSHADTVIKVSNKKGVSTIKEISMESLNA